MRVQTPRSFSFAKAGNRPDENEDAIRYAIPQSTGCTDPPARLAVADGATEAAFSREWANILVDQFVDAEPMDMTGLSEEALDRWLEPCREEWRAGLQRRDIPWHGRAKVKAGAMATFLGVNLRSSGAELWWDALAMGDCCLFIVRQGRLHTAFPVDDPGDFNNTPHLLCSNPDTAMGGHQSLRRDGRFRKGDLFILATDAVACWALTQHRLEEDPWTTLAELCYGPPEHRQPWVAERRADHSMRNDDATLLAVRIG